MMKIVIFNTVPYGSTGRISYQLMKFAKRKGHDVYYITGWTKNKRKGIANEIIATNFVSKATHLVLGKLTGCDSRFSVICTKRIIRYLNEISPDLIHLHIMHDYFVNLELLFDYIKDKNIKVIWTFHDCWAFTGGCTYFSISHCEKWKDGCENCPRKKELNVLGFDSPSYMWRKKLQCMSGLKDVIITTPSKWLEGLVRESFYKRFEIRTIHNGIDIDEYKPVISNFRDSYNIKEQYIVLGVAFDWSERKGLDLFDEFAEKLDPRYAIVLVGTNDSIDKYLNKRIYSIHRTSSKDELIKIYSTADVFVNPTREEVFGMVNIEALACGTPVVMFDTDGSPECIDDSCGIVVEENSVNALIEAINYVCLEKRFESENCRLRASKFSEKICYEEFMKVYSELFDQSRTKNNSGEH